MQNIVEFSTLCDERLKKVQSEQDYEICQEQQTFSELIENKKSCRHRYLMKQNWQKSRFKWIKKYI